MTSFNPFRVSLVFVLATIMSSNAFVMRTRSTTTTTSCLAVLATATEQSLLSVELEKPLGIILEEVEEDQAKGVFVLDLADDGSAAASEFKNQLVGLPLAKVMGADVTHLDFDSVMDQLIAAPSPINLDFIVDSTTLPSSTTSTKQSLLSVELEKPLGIILEEVVEDQAKGVFVLELADDGSAATSEFKHRLVGLPLAKVMGADVTNLDFDSVMDQLIAAPSPISLEFIVGSDDLMSSSSPPDAEEIDELPLGTIVAIKVLGDKGNPETIIEAKVGDNLRKTLQENNIEVYQGMKQKLGNCGGGGTCTFCAANFIESEGWSERSDYENQRLAKAPDARLTCLNPVQGPATIRLV